MTALEEARTALNRLSVPERQKLLDEMADQSLEVAPGIFQTPGVCGGDACIRSMRLPVWQLEGGRRSGASDSQLLAAHPDLTCDDLHNAWSYVEKHRAKIDQAIEENLEA